MEPIANIVTMEPVDVPYFINVTGDTSNIINDVPTLVVGWETVKRLYPDASILNRDLPDGLKWTFGRREKGDVFEKEISDFLNEAVGMVIARTEYRFVNVLIKNNPVFNEFVERLKESPMITVVQYKEMVYAYPEDGNTVYGISLRDCDYAGYNRKAMARRISELCGDRRRIGMMVGCPYHEIVSDFNGKAYMLPKVISASLGSV